MSEEINVRFVIPKECDSEDDCCEDMKLAFTVSVALHWLYLAPKLI